MMHAYTPNALAGTGDLWVEASLGYTARLPHKQIQ